jgi:hypothetical protein
MITAQTPVTASPIPRPPAPAPKRLAAPRFDQCRVYGSIAIAAPAIRLVLVEGWAHQGEVGHSVLPVVAVSSVLVSEYSRARSPGSAPADPSASVETLEKDGWRLDWTAATHDAIVADPETGELCEARFAFDSVNSVHRIVAASWDASEDSVHLATTIALVERQAVRKAAENGYWDGSIDAGAGLAEEVD